MSTAPGVPASMFQSINPIYIILLAPLFALLWTKLGRDGLEPSAPAKFGLGHDPARRSASSCWSRAPTRPASTMPTPVIFIFLIYLLHTTGELCLSPVGLSAMNRLAPAHMASLIMGTWFFASATGNFAAGLIAAATGAESASGEARRQGHVCSTSTRRSAGSPSAWASRVLVISPLIKKLMHLDTLRDNRGRGACRLQGGRRRSEPGSRHVPGPRNQARNRRDLDEEAARCASASVRQSSRPLCFAACTP